MSRNPQKRIFTLVELIVGISIMSVLLIVSFLMLTKWIGKSKDTGRKKDIYTIQMALEQNVLKSSIYPLPDNNFSVYDTGGILAWYQGEFGTNAADFVETLNKVPSDSNNQKYGYSVTYDKKHYQVRAILEASSSVLEKAYADSQTAYIDGVYNGFIITNSGTNYYLWNVPSLFVWSGAQISNGTNYLHQNGKILTNTTILTGMNINGLYDTDTSNDVGIYSSIASTYPDQIKDSDAAKTAIQDAAGSGVSGSTATNAGSGGCVLDSSTFPCALQ